MTTVFRCELLKAWRSAQGLTQKEAGDLVNISQAYWGELENGEKAPSVGLLHILATITGITVDDLLGNPTQPRSGDRARQAV